VIDTPMLAKAANPTVIEALKAATPIRRIARVDEVARAVLFLSCEASSYMVGHAMPIDGGASIC
jgi:NAD(P)-dependent dehydrogenase (short-subunit alcohol dehydrogenase family)